MRSVRGWKISGLRPGRPAEDVKSLTVLRIVTANTEIEAQRKYDQLQSNYHLQAQLVSYAGDTGIDISRYADGDALSTHTEGMTSYVMRADGSGKPLTAGDVKQRFANVTRASDLILVGTPQQVAERIEEHARICGTTGYMLNPLISPASLEDFVELVDSPIAKAWPVSHRAPARHLAFATAGRRGQSLAGQCIWRVVSIRPGLGN